MVSDHAKQEGEGKRSYYEEEDSKPVFLNPWAMVQKWVVRVYERVMNKL